MKTYVEIHLSPNELANVFIEWGSDEQAKFINLVGKHFKGAGFDAELQCSYMSDEVNKDGKDFIFTLANFIKCQKIKPGSPHEGTLINSYETDGLRG